MIQRFWEVHYTEMGRWHLQKFNNFVIDKVHVGIKLSLLFKLFDWRIPVDELAG